MSARRRPGYVYAFKGYHPQSLLRGRIKIVWLYVGKTRQKPETRWRQHQFGSPNGEPAKVWWPLVTDKVVLKRRSWISETSLDWKESWQITKLWPVANIKLNHLNPRRIPPWEMKRLMSQITATGGVLALVERAQGRNRAWAGWSIGANGSSVEHYGSEAERIGARWLNQSTGFLSSSESPLAARSGTGSKKRVSGSTARGTG